jgi:hypothetical protein
MEIISMLLFRECGAGGVHMCCLTVRLRWTDKRRSLAARHDAVKEFIIYPGSGKPSTKSKLLFNKIKISTHIPLNIFWPT